MNSLAKKMKGDNIHRCTLRFKGRERERERTGKKERHTRGKKKNIQKSARAGCVDRHGIYNQGSNPALNQQHVALFIHEEKWQLFSEKKREIASVETSIRVNFLVSVFKSSFSAL